MIPVTASLFAAAALAVPSTLPSRRLGAGARDPKRPRDGPPGAPAAAAERAAGDIGLFAACAQAGLPPALAAAAVADTYAGDAFAGGTSPWHTTAALLALGADPERAWSELHALPGGADLAHLVTLSNSSGAALAESCDRIAERLREEATDTATAKAERAGVLIAIPLTAFFLPAFFALGLAPVVISLGASLLH